MVKAGDVLIHPTHGELTITNVGASEYEEFIPDESGFLKGHRIEGVFDRFIPGVQWVVKKSDGVRISKLIFHSWYLRKFEKKGLIK